MHRASLLLDSEFRVQFSSYYSPGIEPSDVLGRKVWECCEMTPASRKSIRECMSAVVDDGRPHSYTLDGPVTGLWRTLVHPCRFPVVRFVLEAQQMPAALNSLTGSQLEFCRMALTRDSKAIAKLLRCSVQTVSYRRAVIAKHLGIHPSDFRPYLAGLRHWLE